MAEMGVWKPLSRQVVPSSGQGNWTFDCQSGNFENYGSGNHAACVGRLEEVGARKNGRA